MKETRKATKFAGIGALALLLATSAFAAPAPRDGDWTRGQNSGQAKAGQQGRQQFNNVTHNYRDNERINASGRVTSFARERDGYRVQLDGRGSYWIPAASLGSHIRDLRVGVSLDLGGFFRGGVINVNAVSWPGAYAYASAAGQGYVQGVVERVDYRTGFATIRDDATGRLLDVDMRATQNVNFRPGDQVSLSGQWVNGNVFDALRVDSIN